MKRLVLCTALGLIPTALGNWHQARGKSIEYTSEPGYFLQDDNATDPSGFDYASNNFGLIDRDYLTDEDFDPRGTKSQWEHFNRWVRHLNARARLEGGSSQYKVLFMGRHGNGWHNAAESYYGTPAWNCYWAEQTGNGTATWSDPLLTPDGRAEARKANAYYRDRHATQNMPHFESYYSSPLTRCTTTANLTFGDLDLPVEHPFIPTVKEGFREGMTVHTCNRRSDRSRIHELFPWYRFELGFTEEDVLWSSDDSETDAAELVRAKVALDDVFRADHATWVSITAHEGIISRLLRALNHRPFRLGTGQIIPVLVRADVVDLQPKPTFVAHEPYSTCDSPPIESIEGQGCVCTTPTASPGPTPTAKP